MAETKEKLEKEQEKLFADLQKKHDDLLQRHIEMQDQYKENLADLQKKHDEAVEKLAMEIQKQSVSPITQTQAKQVAETQLNAAQPQSVIGLNLATAGMIANDYGIHPAHSNDVKFNVTKPGDTGMKEGITVVSKESAEHFEKIGIGKIVK